ncbi:type IV pilus assembly PilZ [Denitrovibrio acetiphilus DSM 12809]|uniref:Type IV pilus assembly PilZ n=1 Tax=Denitrovibrio acetiphilus (strain DSM 12809 / NBRC 114555 / N2460) TaxID=522772 RepID=D4H306_DENA2|nr:PilZ domain-containing protein [Denitrovibrio acetiphilus]ADD69029.1 type IV pilus assembly PilZ [Denitrovibrio acetiphilus DSM 12809]
MINKVQRQEDNRRKHMRVKSRLHFCVSVIEGKDTETGKHRYGNCICATTTDISIGGMCIPDAGKLELGQRVELSPPGKMTQPACLNCEEAYLHKNHLDLTPIAGRIVWQEGGRCGVQFTNLSRRNENVLSKFIWEEHLHGVRNSKKQSRTPRKF